MKRERKGYTIVDARGRIHSPVHATRAFIQESCDWLNETEVCSKEYAPFRPYTIIPVNIVYEFKSKKEE
jgi:hypothetical protein